MENVIATSNKDETQWTVICPVCKNILGAGEPEEADDPVVCVVCNYKFMAVFPEGSIKERVDIKVTNLDLFTRFDICSER